MAIDYSKWDKIELSDDSDVEVHPNVDKKSFIRWKQQDIHQKRDQRNHDIKTLEIQNAMYDELNKRVDQILSKTPESEIANFDHVKTYLQSNFDPNSKPDGIEEDGPTHNEMIEDLFTQLKVDLEKSGQDPSDGGKVKELVLSHRKKIDDVLERNHTKLKELYKERELHISSDDMHTGWDRSFLNKGDGKDASKDQSKSQDVKPSTEAVSSAASAYSKPSAATISDEKPTTQETTPAASIPTQENSQPAAQSTTQEVAQTSKESNGEETLDDLHPDTFAYSQIPIEKIDQIKSFLKSHTHIITPNQKDSLLMKAFDAQFAHENKRTYQIIFLSTILQYIYDIVEYKRTRHPQEIAQIVEQLLSKMFINAHNQAFEAFKSEVERTYAHIKQRCEVLTQEQYEEVDEADQEIQLKSLDENSELIVNLPDSNSKDPAEVQRYEVFQKLPKNMQDALKTENLDEVNKVFRGIPIKEAEEILEIFEQCEVIGVQAVIENENDWREIKHEYEQSQSQAQSQSQQAETKSDEPRIEELGIKDHDYENTADIVD